MKLIPVVFFGVIAGGIVILKLFSFRHVGPDDPTVSLLLGTSVVSENSINGEPPLSIDRYVLLAQSENGFPGELVYLSIMQNAWVLTALLAGGIVLLLTLPRH